MDATGGGASKGREGGSEEGLECQMKRQQIYICIYNAGREGKVAEGWRVKWRMDAEGRRAGGMKMGGGGA